MTAVNLGSLAGRPPACTCGTAMRPTPASHAARERIVYYRCPACGNTGYINEGTAP